MKEIYSIITIEDAGGNRTLHIQNLTSIYIS
jgi:hypothetical protein